MTMKKVLCEMVYHFKGKLLLHMVCSLGSHVEINLTDTCNSTKEQHMLQGLAIQEVCRVPSLVCLTWLTMLFILVQCARNLYHPIKDRLRRLIFVIVIIFALIAS